MKTILALLVSFITVTTAFAQTDAQKEEAKRVILGERRSDSRTEYPRDDRTVYGGNDRRYPERYPNTSVSTRERQLYEINRTYDEKIYSIRTNQFLTRNEKERFIRQLEMDRRNSLAQYDNRYHRNNDRSYENDNRHYKKAKKYKHNNGKHKGWYNDDGDPYSGK